MRKSFLSILLAAAASALLAAVPEPILYAPLEGQADATGPKGEITANSSEVKFIAAPMGKGALLMRYGYDRRTVLSFGPVDRLASPSFTASCYFVPNWDALDGATHGLLSMKSEDCSWSFHKDSEGFLIFGAFKGQAKAYARANVSTWKKGEAKHLAIVSDAAAGTLSIFIDAKLAGSVKSDVWKGMALKAGQLIAGDIPTADTYSKTQAEGVVDEIRVFDKALSSGDLEAELTRKDRLPVVQRKVELPILPPNDAELKLWDLAGAWREKTPERETICLNALWRCQLTETLAMPGKGDWNYLPVPGRYAGQETGGSENAFQFRDASFKKIPFVRGANEWKGKAGHDYKSAWFERSFAADPAWRQTSLSLRFDELSPSETGEAYLNGELVASIGKGKALCFDIDPAKLKYDAPNILTVHAVDSGARWNWRGIKGDVWLLVRPKVQIAEEPRIETSVRNGRISVFFQVRNLGNAPAAVQAVARVSGENALKEPLKSQAITLAPGASAELQASADWDGPRFWDTEDPYLYECQASLVSGEGKELDAMPPLKFGFREFWIDKGDFVLNGLPIHLRADDGWYGRSSDLAWCKKWASEVKRLGYNAIRGPFSFKDIDFDTVIKACDETGVLLFIDVGGVRGDSYATWNLEETRQQVAAEIEGMVKPWRNRPSIAMWFLSTNFLGYGWDYHPLKISDGYLPKGMDKKLKACDEGVAMLMKLDSTRPFFYQAGGNFGPVYTSNGYFGWWPLAEQMQWPEEWAKTRSKPLFMIETSFPYFRDWLGMDIEHGKPTPYLLPEQGARFLGCDAYRALSQKDMEMLGRPPAKVSDWEILAAERPGIEVQRRVKDLLLAETLKYWRGYGISGFIPFAEIAYAFNRKSQGKAFFDAYVENASPSDYRSPGWKADQYKWPPQFDVDADKPFDSTWQAIHGVVKPLLAYIGGPSSEPTLRDHVYYSGDEASKCLVVVNDLRGPFNSSFSWRVLDAEGNAALEGGKAKLSLRTGEIAKIPLKFKAPPCEGAPCVFKIAVEFEGSSPKVEPFEFSCYPATPKASLKGAVAAFDPEGVTSKAMKKLGVEFKDSKSLSSLDGISLFVVGRNALGGEFAKEAARLKLSEAVKDGGVFVAVFEQPSLAHMGLATNETFSRDVFAAKGSPLLAGLSEKDLSWPRGDGSLVPGNQAPDPFTEGSVKSPFWHWSDRNLACPFPAKRPDAAGSRAHLLAGMDLSYSPLLETGSGKGGMLFCQYELSARVGTDPAAGELMKRILEYGTQTPKRDFKSLCALKRDARASKLLDQICLEPVLSESVSECQPGSIIVVDAHGDSLLKAMKEAEEKAKEGATVVFMPLSKEDVSSLGMLSTEFKKLSSYKLTKEGERLLGGLDDRDMFFHIPVDAVGIAGDGLEPLTSPSLIAVRKLGKGMIVHVQLDPELFDSKMEEIEKQLGKSSSELWLLGALKERLLLPYGRLLSSAGALPSGELAERLESPANDLNLDLRGEWKFSVDPYEKGESQGWQAPGFDDSSWRSITVPGLWEPQGVTEVNPKKPSTNGSDYDGAAWYRKSFKIPDEMQGKELFFSAPKGIDDFDDVYVDGTKIGHTGNETPGWWQAPRYYRVAPELTKGKGSVCVAIRVFDDKGGGGIPSTVVELVLKAAKTGHAPYWSPKPPSYDTEKHIRW